MKLDINQTERKNAKKNKEAKNVGLNEQNNNK